MNNNEREKQIITRKYKEKTITLERKKKIVKQDTRKQLRISKELIEQVESKLKALEKHEKEYGDFSSLVRFLLEEWLK